MNKVANNISVDSGTILISDPSFYEKWKGSLNENSDLYKIFKVNNGKYKVKTHIDETYHGPVDNEGILEITSGKMIVSDPCYHFHPHDIWMNLLDSTDYMRAPIDGCLVLDKMGGDGCYDVEIELEECHENE